MRSVEDSIAAGRVVLRHPGESRNAAPVGDAARRDRRVRLRRAASAARGATRRRRAPRSASSRSAMRSASGTPSSQRPELWNLYNARDAPGRERARVPDLELDRARRLAVHRAREARGAVDLSRARRARSSAAARRWWPVTAAHAAARRRARRERFACASAPSATSPARRRSRRPRRRSTRSSSRRRPRPITERGATRLDDQTHDASMELRKKEGYF